MFWKNRLNQAFYYNRNRCSQDIEDTELMMIHMARKKNNAVWQDDAIG
jgi:hypothetical protein